MSYLSKKAQEIVPYIAGEQPKIKDIVKLNTNENPYPPSDMVKKAIAELDKDVLKLYPNPEAKKVKQAAAKLHGVSEENIFVGNGSDEVLAVAFLALFDGPLRFADVTYSFYPVWASLYDIETDVIPLKEDYTIDVEKFMGARNAIFPNPNAPTGIALSLEDVKRIVKSAKGAVVVDEAYADFGAKSAIALIDECPNLLVVRTLSKSHSLAGLRLGYAVGNKELIDGLIRIKDSFNSYPVDAIAEAAGSAALLDAQYEQDCVKKVIATRERTVNELEKLGFSILPSAANFIFAKPPVNAKELFLSLRERGIIVRYFEKPRTKDYLRITIGTDSQMDRLIAAVKELI